LCFVGLGLAIHERLPSALPFLIVLVVYPLPYYVSYVFEKYRHPIEPLLFILAAYPLVRVAHFGWEKIFNRKDREEELQRSQRKPVRST
jgi:hypothetical protein